MATNQPKWNCVGHIGDVDPIAYGGGFIYEDRTGRYDPELVYFEPEPDNKLGGNTPLTVYRLIIEKDSTREWWYEKLDALVSFSGMSADTMRRYANGSTLERASLYETLIHYYGAYEFDSYPRKTTEGKAYFRYWREMRRSIRGAA